MTSPLALMTRSMGTGPSRGSPGPTSRARLRGGNLRSAALVWSRAVTRVDRGVGAMLADPLWLGAVPAALPVVVLRWLLVFGSAAK